MENDIWGEGREFRKCKGAGGRVWKKIKCGSKMTGKGRSRKRNKEEPRSRKIQEEQAIREVYSKVAICYKSRLKVLSQEQLLY